MTIAATAQAAAAAMVFQLAYPSPSWFQQSQLYCRRCLGGGNLQFMFRLRRGTEKVAMIGVQRLAGG
jgi:hypothetical protein